MKGSALMNRIFALALTGMAALAAPGALWAEPLKITITDGNIEPLPFAAPVFIDEGGAGDIAQAMTQVIAADLQGTGLFTQIDPAAYISQVTSFDAPVAYADWKAINAQALIVGAVSNNGGNISVKFNLYDVFSDTALGEGLQFAGGQGTCRAIAHKVANQL